MKHRILSIICCVFLAAVASGSALGAAFVHPGISHSQAELAFVKSKLKTQEQPWQEAWEKMVSSKEAALSWQTRAVAHVERGAYNRPDIGGSFFMDGGKAAYTHALLWVFTDKEAHALKAAEILNIWSATLESVTNHDAKLLVGMGGLQFCNAAELLKHTWKGWPRKDQQAFRLMLQKVFYPVIQDFFPRANGNWDASMIQTMMAMGIFLDDQAMFQRAADYYLKGAGNGAVNHYFNAFGQCQESGRDQGHTQMGLEYLVNSAEIAWKQGVDLYSAYDNRLAAGFEYTAKYNLGNDVPFEYYESYQGKYKHQKISGKSRGRLRPMYDKIVNHYHNRMGMDMPWCQKATEKTRPETGGTMPWSTLMYADQPADLVRLAAGEKDGLQTVVSIQGEKFLINGIPTYQGRKWNGYPIEGLLMNSRMVQGIFDDLNPETAGRWAYADTKKWDPDRNTDEFVEAMESWYAHGLLAFTINMQGGSPLGYGNKGWINSAYDAKGELHPAYMARLERIMDKANQIGMAPILGLFYNDQEDLLEDEAAVLNAVDNVTDWLFAHDYRHVIIEINNECNLKYRHEILQPPRIHEVIEYIQAKQQNGHRYLVSTSYSGRQIPRKNVVAVADFLLIHGNGVKDPAMIPEMVRKTKEVKGYTPKPILFNEDDHFDFDKPVNHMVLAVQSYASWGLFDYRKRNESYESGFQSVPVDWQIGSPRKKAFFNRMAEITGMSSKTKPPEDTAFVDRVLPAPKGGGYEDPDYWVWGSSVIKGEDGKYHMFASRWLKKLGFGKWVTNSEVVHAVADTPVGPYKTLEVALPVRGKEHWDGMCTHNPKVVKYKNKYLLYYFGNTYDFRQPTVENTELDSEDRTRAWMNKRVGVAISESVYGPWKRLDKPVIEPREGHWDASITSNPAPVVNEKTGEILLMYKSSTYGKRPPLLLGVAKAKSPEGPYERLSEAPIFRFETAENERIDVEDPYVWWNGEKYEAIIKDRSGEICGEEGGGIHAWSDDGVNWHLFEKVKAYSRDVLWDDGTTTHQNHFERPFLLIENGVPTHLFAATGVGPRAWRFDKTWNMVIPLKTEW